MCRQQCHQSPYFIQTMCGPYQLIHLPVMLLDKLITDILVFTRIFEVSGKHLANLRWPAGNLHSLVIISIPLSKCNDDLNI